MKKSFTKLLIISILCVVISTSFAILSIRLADTLSSSRTEKVLNEISKDEEIDDVEGYGYIVSVSTSALADLGVVIGQVIFLVIMPSGILFIIVISQVISRLVQIGENKKWKNSISIILTNLSIVLQIFAVLIWIFDLMCEFEFNRIFIILTLILNLIVIFIFKKELKQINQSIIEEK